MTDSSSIPTSKLFPVRGRRTQALEDQKEVPGGSEPGAWAKVSLADAFSKGRTGSSAGLAPSNAETPSVRDLARARRLRPANMRTVAPSGIMAPSGTVPSSVLGDLIGRGEGDYNSFNRGRAGDASGEILDFSRMSLAEVVRRQSLPRSDPNRLFAVGRFQVIPSTMREAIAALNLDLRQNFTPDLQERIFADFLIDQKRPDIRAYITGESQDLRAAQIALALEFASVARPDTGRSHYDGIGGNRASIGANEAAAALRAMRQQYQDQRARGRSPKEAWDGLRGKFQSAAVEPVPPSSIPEAGGTRGTEGDGVRVLQSRLVELGLMTPEEVATGPGIFGPRTEAAVRGLQRATGRPTNGEFDSPTRAALSALFRGEERGPNADSALTRMVQRELLARGFMTPQEVATGPGVFGPRTERALMAFQGAQGLEPRGRIDVATFRALFDAPQAPNWPVSGYFQVNRADRPGEGDGEFGSFRSGGRRHQGIDLEAPVGTRVEPFEAGEVLLQGPVRGFGNTVVVQHDGGRQTVYAHLDALNVRVGQQVERDTSLGTIGRTGNVPRQGDAHIHFEVREGSRRTPLSGTPIDPRGPLLFPA